MALRRSGLGGQAAVAAAAALLAVCAAGGPLYVSSSASEAVQAQLNEGCLADDGMQLRLAPGSLRTRCWRRPASSSRAPHHLW